MKLPWDRNYFKLCFYVIFTFIFCYISKKLVDMVSYTLVNMGNVFSDLKNIIGTILSVFSVIFLGFAFAYIFDPVVEYFQNKYCKFFNMQKKQTRTAGTTITYIIIIAVIALICVFLINKISNATDNNNSFATNLALAVQGYVDELTKLYEKLIFLTDKYDFTGAVSNIIKNVATAVIGFTQNLGTGTISALTTIGGGFVNVLISFVVAFYFLKDKYELKTKLQKLSEAVLNEKHKKSLYKLLNGFHNIFSGYIRGQLTDGLIMSVLISCGLSIINVRFALVIGIISGFSNIIPYFGAIMGFVLAVAMALIDGELIKALYAAILMLILQQIDTIIIVPKIVGERVKLSPVWVIISLAVAGKLSGIVGMIFAVPVTAIFKMLLDNYINKKLNFK